MNRGSPRPPRPFYTPNNRQQSHPEEQRNTVNIPFYRDTSNRDTYNRNFGAPSPRHFHPNSNYNPQRRGGGGGFGGGGFQDNRRFNNNNHFTPRNNRPHFQRGGGGHGRVSHCLFPALGRVLVVDVVCDAKINNIAFYVFYFHFRIIRRTLTFRSSITRRCCRTRGRDCARRESHRTTTIAGEIKEEEKH